MLNCGILGRVGTPPDVTMPVIGITGGISTGKTTLVECLRELVPEARFFDADTAARELADKDAEVRGLIEKEFGAAVYSSGDLNRGAVRTIVFADAEKKRALEQILHPRIRRQWSLEAEGHRNSTELFFADIPLLYETGGETLCDRVVVVACSPGVQLERLMARTGLGKAEAQQMIDAQMPLTEKISRADHLVWNNGGVDVLKEQARLLVGLWNDGRRPSQDLGRPAGIPPN
jgi:dephospho-CoA kinase